VIWDEVNGVMTLCHTGTVEFFHLDEVGSLIWRACGVKSTIADILKPLAEVYPEEEGNRLMQEINCFVSSLEEARLLERQE